MSREQCGLGVDIARKSVQKILSYGAPNTTTNVLLLSSVYGSIGQRETMAFMEHGINLSIETPITRKRYVGQSRWRQCCKCTAERQLGGIHPQAPSAHDRLAFRQSERYGSLRHAVFNLFVYLQYLYLYPQSSLLPFYQRCHLPNQ